MSRNAHWRSLLLAALLGAVNVFAFAPAGIWLLQLVTMAVLVGWLLRIPTIQRAFLTGWAYGFGWMASGIFWLYVSLHDYGGLAAPLAVLAVVLLSLYLSFYTALCTGLTAWIARRWHATPLQISLAIFPAFWALGEWLRGWIFTGFPWLASGYAHVGSPLAGYAPAFGVYGVGLMAAFTAGCMAIVATDIHLRLNRTRPVILIVFLILACGAGLHKFDWTSPIGKPISVDLLQGNVGQEMKFDRDTVMSSMQLYKEWIGASEANLVATPETAIPVFQDELPPSYLRSIADGAQLSGSYIALGIPLRRQRHGKEFMTNGVLGISPQPWAAAPEDAFITYAEYNKAHLVPFGEFVPFGFHWFMRLIHIPLGDFDRGAALQKSFPVRDQWVLPNVCYEDLFGEEIAHEIYAADDLGVLPPTILLNMSNIGWFGNTIAIPQHLQISRMRALETGRPMLRATNTGATAIIDQHGKVVKQLTPFVQNRLQGTVQGYKGRTLYILTGNALVVWMALLMLVLAGLSDTIRDWWQARESRQLVAESPAESQAESGAQS
jgi:apolipoprotein N-acyltransferase